MADNLDVTIHAIQEHADTILSAEARNYLHGCLSTHPWCHGKPFDQRKQEALAAIAGRSVHGKLRHDLERARS